VLADEVIVFKMSHNDDIRHMGFKEFESQIKDLEVFQYLSIDI